MPFSHSEPNSHPPFKRQVQACLAVPIRRNDDGARKRAILAAVLQEWADVSFLKANVISIAGHAGVSTATLYRLFPNRHDMNLGALRLGHKLILAAMLDRVTHPNPIRNLIELVLHYASILLERQYRQFSIAQTFQVRRDAPNGEAASSKAQAGYLALHRFWQNEITRLINAGFVEPGLLNHQMFRLIGPIEARALHWYQAGRGHYVPNQSWLHEAIDVVEGFFRIYGTKKYQIFSRAYQLDWLGQSINSAKQSPGVRLLADPLGKQDSLPLIGELERNLQAGSPPKDFMEFALRELEQMSSRQANRLNATNRRNRILAAAIYENYEHGFENLSMSAIAKRAGVSTATLYRQFPNDDALHMEAHALGMSLFCAWVGQDNSHTNPLARMTAYIFRPLKTYTDPDSLRLGSIQFGLIARVEEGGTLPTAPLLIRYIFSFWAKRFGRLIGENYINKAPSWTMIHDIFGPIQSMSWALQSNTGVMPAPEGSWWDACWQVSEDFFKVYGTPYFHARCAAENWKDDREGLRP
jgi:AcrR family transcriptional regulator